MSTPFKQKNSQNGEILVDQAGETIYTIFDGGDYMKLNERLRTIRENHGMNRRELAEQLKMPYGTLSKYETGEREPGVDFVITLAKYYGVTVDYLLGLTEYPHGHFAVDISDTTPQIDTIVANAKKLNVQGLKKLEEYSDDLVSSGKYEKATYKDGAV